MLQAFFDDGGSFKDSGLLCLAGYVSDDGGWMAFEKEWAVLLAKHGMDSLRTSDFLSGTPPYADSALGQGNRVKIVQEFIQITRKHVLFGVSVGVDAKAYKELTARERKKSPPERFCFYRLLHRVITRAAQWNYEGLFSLVFDDSDEHSSKFCGALRDFKTRKSAIRNAVASISFANDKMVLPLQAANLLASLAVGEIRKGDQAWIDNPLGDLLLRADPAYGLLYEQEYWGREQILTQMSEIREAPIHD